MLLENARQLECHTLVVLELVFKTNPANCECFDCLSLSVGKVETANASSEWVAATKFGEGTKKQVTPTKDAVLVSEECYALQRQATSQIVFYETSIERL